MTDATRNAEGLKPVSEREVMARINEKLKGTGFSMILFTADGSDKYIVRLYLAGGKVADFSCLDTLACLMGVLSVDEFLCWPEEAAKLAA